MIDAALNSAVASLPPPSWLKVNLTLTFLVPAVGGTGFDSAGNEVSNSQAIVVQASVRRPTKQAQNNQLPGSGTQVLELEGRLVNPKSLPIAISNQLKAFAEYKDTVSGNSVSGEWVFLPTTQNRVGGITQHLGQRIAGNLLLKGAV